MPNPSGSVRAAQRLRRAHAKSDSPSLWRRAAAILTTLALAGGLAVVGAAAPASAHTGDLKAVAECNTETGMYDVTYTLKLTQVGNLKGSTMWKVGTTEFKGTPSNANGMDRGPISSTGDVTLTLGKESIPGTTKGGGPWVYAFTTWSDDYTKGSDGRVENLKGDCKDDSDKIAYCHATGSESNPYTRVETSVNAFYKSGHIDHQGDIWPAFSYKKNGSTIKVAAQGDQSLLQYPDCSRPPTEILSVPTFSDTCGPGNEVLEIPEDVDGYVWSDSREGAVITVTATAEPGYSFKPGTQTSWTFTVDDEPCEIGLQGVPAFSDICGPDNEELFVPTSTDTVLWASTREGSTVTVTATPKGDVVFTPGTRTSWTFTVDDEPCIVGIEFLPSFRDVCGPGNEELEIPEDEDGYVWSSSREGSVITVTATAEPNFAFAPGTKTVWTFDVIDEPCVIDLVGEPKFVDTCGPDNEQLTLPESTETIEWTSSEVDGVITVTATAKAGSKFGEDTQATWVYTIDDAPCITELVGEPSFADVCGPDNEQLVVPADTETVTWSQVETEGVVTVVAVPKNGFAFADGVKSEWSYAIDDAACVQPTLDGSLATGVCEADVPWISYAVALTDPDNQATSDLVTLTLGDGTNSEVIELGELGADGTLSGKTLWPGAAVDDEGNAAGWPGWEQLADGTWQETDDNFAWTRSITTAVIHVNPELSVALSYPPATPDCADGPTIVPTDDGGNGDGDTTVIAETEQSGLASTGFAGTTIAIVAGIIVLAGAAFLVIARVRRKRA